MGLMRSSQNGELLVTVLEGFNRKFCARKRLSCRELSRKIFDCPRRMKSRLYMEIQSFRYHFFKSILSLFAASRVHNRAYFIRRSEIEERQTRKWHTFPLPRHWVLQIQLPEASLCWRSTLTERNSILAWTRMAGGTTGYIFSGKNAKDFHRG